MKPEHPNPPKVTTSTAGPPTLAVTHHGAKPRGQPEDAVPVPESRTPLAHLQ
eukprot:COSAG05_NODE_17846_length_318_cov_0.858447_1_plen_51_part_01